MLLAAFCIAVSQVSAGDVTDVLNRALTGVADGNTNYASWSGKTATSEAVYAGQSAGLNNSIQLRSKNNNSGVVTTTSGGTLKSITVKFNSNTDAARVLDVYVSNSAYSDATDLYGSNTGTKVTSFTMSAGATQSYTFTSEYKYIGFRSNSGALYLDEVDIVWTTSGGGSSSVDATAITLNKTNLSLEQYREETLHDTLTPLNATTAVTWSSSNSAVATVSGGLIKAVGKGDATITASAGQGVSASCTVTVTEPTVLSCAQAATYAATVSANNIPYAGGQYVVEGYVISTSTTSNGYIWLADDADAANGTFQVYKPTNISDIASLNKGDRVRAVGYITKFNSTYEFLSGCTFEKVGSVATKLTLDKTTLSLEQYREEGLTATITPANSDIYVEWSSSNSAIVSVTTNTYSGTLGWLKAVSKGTATITATASNGSTDTCVVTVTEPTVLSCAQAAAYAATVSSGNYEGGQYVVEGYVISTQTSYPAYIWLADDPTASSGTFEVYRPNNSSSDISSLSVGDKVRAVGYITKYGDTPEFAAGCTFEKVVELPSTVTLSADKMAITAGETVNFSYRAENTETATFKKLEYNLVGSSTSTTVNEQTITFTEAGTYEVRCTVTCDKGDVVSNVIKITVESAIYLHADKSTALINEAVTFSYTSVAMANPQLVGLYYRYKGDDDYILSNTLTVRFDEAGTFEIYVRVQDGTNYYNSEVIEVSVKKANADATPSSGEKTYLHVFSSELTFSPGPTNLSGVKWDISAGSWTNFNYDTNYKGLQLGYSSMTSPKTFTFTTHSAWGEEENDYSELKTIKSIRIWLSNGNSSSISAVVTVNGQEIACSGNCTVTRTTNVASYLNQSMLTFIPEEGNNEGVIEIQLTTNAKISYFCAISIDCEGDITPATVNCLPASNEVYKGIPVSFDFELSNAKDGEFMYLTYWKDGVETNKEYQSLPSINFAEAGTYNVTITVNSNKGQVTSVPVAIVVNERAAGSWLVTFKDYDGTVLSTQLVQNGNAAEEPSHLGRFGYRFIGWDGDIAHITSDVTFTAQYTLTAMNYQATSFEGIKLPDATLFYDFNKDGKPQALYYVDDYHPAMNYKDIATLSDYTNNFAVEQTKQSDYRPFYIEDVDNDGLMEIGTVDDNRAATLFGNGIVDEVSASAMAVTGLDINGDGRLDMMTPVTSNMQFIWYEHLSTGGFTKRTEELSSLSTYTATYSDPIDEYISALDALKSTAGGTQTAYPTKAIDLNNDGYIDLVDESQGHILFNMGNGKWVQVKIAIPVTIADFNNDGYVDLLILDKDLKVYIYDGNGTFTVSKLLENTSVDPKLYCYDFDKDGDTDILTTVSACWNTTNATNYVQIFKNDGKGNFAKAGNTQTFSDYMQFSNLADIDGDGFYDLLAFRGTTWQDGTNSYKYFAAGTMEVVMLRGKSDLTFETPESVYSLDNTDNCHESRLRPLMKGSYMHINAEDLNGDGIPEIWTSGVKTYSYVGGYNIYSSKVATNPAGTARPRPTAPAQPTLTHNEGLVTITWTNGADANTATSDLTYALRIGTTPGGNEILHAHANADGTRRNFLDGNMGKRHSYTIDLRTYPAMDIYVSVQTVNAAHQGSAWSAEATMHYGYINDNFSLNRTNYTLGEQVIATFTPMPAGYARTFTLGDGTLVSQNDITGTAVFTFASPGTKTITMTVTMPNNEQASSEKTIVVLPNSIGTITNVSSDYQITGMMGYSSTFDQSKSNIVADYNFDGYWDGTYNRKMYDGNANMTSLSTSTGFWNTNLYFQKGLFYDWNHDGYFDLVYSASSLTDGRVLPHNGSNDFVEDDIAIGAVSDMFRNNTNNRVDFTHSGYPEFFLDGQIKIYENGVYTAYDVDATQKTLVKTIALCDRHVDWNHDGFMDVVGLYAEPAYNYLGLLLNNGNGTFAVQTIPFAQSISSATSGNNDMVRWGMADMDNDGDYDIVAQRYEGDIYIMWNEQNQSFSAPQLLPKGDDVIDYGAASSSYANRVLMVSDIDNDGYKDIITSAYSTDKEYGFYAYYMGTEREVRLQGFLTRNTRLGSNGAQIVNMWADAPRIFSVGWVPLTGATNAAPSAPTNLRATQTAEGLLIEWDPALDDHTPANQMRYNISVSHRGQTGEGSYVISPQNGAKNGTVYMPDYPYIEATRFLIPMKYLTDGNYNIRVQALDGWNQLSAFSSQLKATIEASASISAPTSVCVNNLATITYNGTLQTGTPTWDFDGGVAGGSGFGPYTVTWSTPGTKTVSISTNGLNASAEIYVEAVESGVVLPEYVFDNTTVAFDIPDGCTTRWTIPNKPASLEYSSNSLTFNNVGSGTWEVKLAITNSNGCTETIQQMIRVLTQDEVPAIRMIDTDESNHHRIAFAADETLFPQVEIRKETNVANVFEAIATVDATEGVYIDLFSDASKRAERYVVAGVMEDGTKAPQSAVHQTLHLTINKSVYDNTFNLIWNGYVGADVVTYNILRGASKNALQQITSVSAFNTSYTDVSPDAAQPYYAIEFVLNESVGTAAPAKRAPQRAQGTLVGRSNVVNSLTDLPTGNEEVLLDSSSAPRKIMINNVIYILRDGKAFNVQGAEVILP